MLLVINIQLDVEYNRFEIYYKKEIHTHVRKNFLCQYCTISLQNQAILGGGVTIIRINYLTNIIVFIYYSLPPYIPTIKVCSTEGIGSTHSGCRSRT